MNRESYDDDYEGWDKGSRRDKEEAPLRWYAVSRKGCSLVGETLKVESRARGMLVSKLGKSRRVRQHGVDEVDVEQLGGTRSPERDSMPA